MFSITNGLVLYLLLLQIVVLLKRLSSNHREKSDSYLLIILGSVLMIYFLSFCNPAYEYFYCKCLFQKRFIILWKRIIILNWNKKNKNRAKFWFFIPPKVIPFSQNRSSHREFELVLFKLIKKKAGDLDYDIPKTGNSCWIATLPCANIIIKKKLQLKTPK